VGISLRQFEQMKDRVAGKTSRDSVLLTAPNDRLATSVSTKIILGVDPSLRGTGYGVIQAGRPNPVVLTHGTIVCARDWERSRCLAQIARTLREVLQQYHPEVCAVEGLFFAQNLKTAIIMGEARGAAMAVIAEAGLDIYEIAARKVKQAVVGYGAAQKIAVAKMVQRMLNLADLPAPDAADALALALTYAQGYSRYRLQPPKKI
jgi:crossover junction endodeoxyribonuclease RuvC